MSTTREPPVHDGSNDITRDRRRTGDLGRWQAQLRRASAAPGHRPLEGRGLVAAAPASYVAFDLLAIGGVDLRTQRWTVRRGRLEQLAARWALPLQWARRAGRDWHAFVAAAAADVGQHD
jgi:hypothetical protein